MLFRIIAAWRRSSIIHRLKKLANQTIIRIKDEVAINSFRHMINKAYEIFKNLPSETDKVCGDDYAIIITKLKVLKIFCELTEETEKEELTRTAQFILTKAEEIKNDKRQTGENEVDSLNYALLVFFLVWIGVSLISYILIVRLFLELFDYRSFFLSIVSGLIPSIISHFIVRKYNCKNYKLKIAIAVSLYLLLVIILIVILINVYGFDDSSFHHMVVTEVYPNHRMLSGHEKIYVRIEITHSDFTWGRQKITYRLYKNEQGELGELIQEGERTKFFSHRLGERRVMLFSHYFNDPLDSYILILYINDMFLRPPLPLRSE